jgi:hypothetical protein
MLLHFGGALGTSCRGQGAMALSANDSPASGKCLMMVNVPNTPGGQVMRLATMSKKFQVPAIPGLG